MAWESRSDGGTFSAQESYSGVFAVGPGVGSHFGFLMQKPFAQREGVRKITAKRGKAHSRLGTLTRGDPGNRIHSPFGPWEKGFVSCAGLWSVVFL